MRKDNCRFRMFDHDRMQRDQKTESIHAKKKSTIAKILKLGLHLVNLISCRLAKSFSNNIYRNSQLAVIFEINDSYQRTRVKMVKKVTKEEHQYLYL